MSKISVDITKDGQSGVISQDKLIETTTGCLLAMKKLGQLGRLIEVFRIRFSDFDICRATAHLGPEITMHYRDPFGSKFSFEIDFRRVGTGKPDPSAAEVCKEICAAFALVLEGRFEMMENVISDTSKSLKDLRKM